MRVLASITLVTAASLAIHSPLAAQDAAGQVEAAIRAHWDAINAGDMEAVVRHHAPRITAFLQNEGPLYTSNSRAEQREDFAAFEEVRSEWRVRDLTIDVYGDVAVAAFYLEGRAVNPDGSVVEGPRRCTEIWRRIDGAWKEVHHHDSPLVSEG